jgi:hypothetical protein
MCDEVGTLTGSPLQHEDCPMLSTESFPLDGGEARGFEYSGVQTDRHNVSEGREHRQSVCRIC